LSALRILLVSSMYPGASDPDFGVFVKQIADALSEQGHEVTRVVNDRRAGSIVKQAELTFHAVQKAISKRPDVVYVHYLVPAGLAAAMAAATVRAPLVLTAHGRDVRNIGEVLGVRSLTKAAVARSARVVAVSDFLRRELIAKLPELEGRVDVVDSGVDLEQFRGRDAATARTRVGWHGERPFFLCIGTLDRRKNVQRLGEAFLRLERGNLAFVGDGPARPSLEGKPRIRVVGRVSHREVADWIAASDVVCQPSLVEPFGQALLEALASERSVVATRIGGPPEFVTPDVGVLVDPESVDSIEAGLRAAAALPVPNPAARAVAAEHDVRRQAARIADLLERAAGRAKAQ
jgi:glycosyltransferase involved in cell wall biosynthesis